LEGDIDDFKSEAEKKAKNYYTSCLDDEHIKEQLGKKPLLDLLDVLGGWAPISSNFSVDNWTLQNVLEKSHNL
jgi:membrane metallo-endopeptidase-like protein 1